MKCMLLLLFVVGVVVCQPPQGNGNPGMRFRVTEKGVNKFLSYFKEALEGLIKEVGNQETFDKMLAKIQKYGGSTEAGGFSVTKVTFTKAVLPDIKVNYMPPNKEELTLTDGDLDMAIDVKMGEQEGTIKITMKNVQGTIGFAVTNNGGKPQYEKTECSTTYEFALDTESEALKPIIEHAKKWLKKNVKGQLCKGLTKFMPMVNAQMMAKPTKVPLADIISKDEFPEGYVMDTALVGDVVMTEEYAQYDMKGCVHAEDQDRMAMQFNPKTLVDKSKNDMAFHFFMSDEVINQAFREAYKQKDKINAMIPPLDGDVIKAKMIETKAESGFDIKETDTIEASAKFAAPPTVEFSEEKNGMIAIVESDLTIKHVRDGKTLCEPTLTIKATMLNTISIEEGEKPIPVATESAKVTDLKVTKMDGMCQEIGDDKKPKLEAGLKELAQGWVNKYTEKMNKKQQKEMARIPPMLTKENLQMKLLIAFFDNTAEIGFDVDADVTALMEIAKQAFSD